MTTKKPDIRFIPSGDINDPYANYHGFHPGTTLLPKGYVYEEGRLELPCEIVFDRDVAIPLRDGVKIYADIYRPNTQEKVPVICNITCFGKNGSYFTLDVLAKMSGNKERFGIPRSATSGMETWEGIDPAFWVDKGYAVANVDMRGAYMSEGDAHYFGSQEAEDDYDIIEWMGTQPWCNGKVSMAGNSWLAIVQWYAASQQPPHLACIAPWEGHTDLYRDEMYLGGIANYQAVRLNNTYGVGGMEDLRGMMETHPLMDDYWADKVVDLSRIECPAYVVASWPSVVHCQGTFRAWREIASKEKWLRVHNTQEWPDLYDAYNSYDLLRFYDHYMKGINNGWENTPKVRLSVLDPGGQDNIGRMETEFPLARQQLTPLYIDGKTMSLDPAPVQEEAAVRYCGDDGKSVVKFSMTFDREAEITGYIKAKLWVEAVGNDDMDICVKVSKTDGSGQYLYHNARLSLYSGPNTRHRVSLRKTVPEKSLPEHPYYAYDTVEKLAPGEIVPVEIAIWPAAMRFHKGEKLELAVSGFMYMQESSPMSQLKVDIQNKGDHVLHTGGKYDSHLLVPFIPIEE